MAMRRRLVFCATWGVRPRARTCATKARVSEPRSAPRVAPAGTRATMANAASHSAVPVAGGTAGGTPHPWRVVLRGWGEEPGLGLWRLALAVHPGHGGRGG